MTDLVDEQKIRDLQREYLDFLDDDVSIRSPIGSHI